MGGAHLVAIALLAAPIGTLRAEPTSPKRVVDVQSPPPEMHFCWTNCFTLTFDNGIYRRTDGSDETWTVERFTAATIVLHRHDALQTPTGSNSDVVYRGEVSNDRLINVTVDGHPVPDVNLAWGFALQSLPGSNAERNRRQAAQAAAQAQTQALAARSELPHESAEPDVDLDLAAADAPPPLLNYEQAPCPDEGYLWTPGYWNRRGAGYYWVPGAWVQPPRVGLLWTPGYWAFMGGMYVFHAGYWGPHVGYYGGINYRYGYFGSGFIGGRWEGDSFAYNRAVSNLDARVFHHTYRESAAGTAARNNVSFTGGPGGAIATPTVEERTAAADAHISATPRQREILLLSAANPDLRAQSNRPPPVPAAMKNPAVVVSVAGVTAGGGPAATVSIARAARPPTVVRSNGTAHPQPAVERPSVRGNAAHPADEAGSEPSAPPKLTHAAAAKPKHPK